jgi:phospholipase C
VFVYDSLQPAWLLYPTIQAPPIGTAWLGSSQTGQWPAGAFHDERPGTAGHQLIGLEDGQLLDRDLGDGSTRVWRIVQSPGGRVDVVLVAGLTGGPRDELSRGHRVVPLGGGRLLVCMPPACGASSSAPTTARDCAAYRVWSTTLDPTTPHDPVDPQPLVSALRSDIGSGDDVLADDTSLYVWTRARGRLRSVLLDPTAADPLPPEGQPWPNDVVRMQLVSQDWDPPTASPAIKHIVVILQDGRSFDAYFGQHCQSDLPSVSNGPNCEGGPICCQAMPASIPGAAACAPIGSMTDAHTPHADPDCMRSKIAGGEMSRFALGPPQGTCGDPLDFACAGPDSTPGTPADYWNLAATGALADNFFQTYAYADGPTGPFALAPATQNLLYLEMARFADTFDLDDTPLITKALTHVQVSWAMYTGPSTLPQVSIFSPGQFYDPDWYPYRALATELDRDIATGELPSVALILPDVGDPATSESPGHPVGPAIAFVKRLQDEISTSPLYGGNTLVLLTYLTAGGYYDHVSPPAPLGIDIDGSSSNLTTAGTVYYGPRVPLLVFPPFARRNQISHVQLELTSIGRFIDWNWRRGNTLKGDYRNDGRRFRDTVVNNLGSLIDPDAAQVEVPIFHD